MIDIKNERISILKTNSDEKRIVNVKSKIIQDNDILIDQINDNNDSKNNLVKNQLS